MTKVLRILLYWLARVAGLVGLVAAARSLGKFVLAWSKDPEADTFSYNDVVFSGSVIFLLSLLVLIFADIGSTLAKNSGLMAGGPAGASKVPGGSAGASARTVGGQNFEAEIPSETADEKLARLVKQKRG